MSTVKKNRDPGQDNADQPVLNPSAESDIGQFADMYAAPRAYTPALTYLNSEAQEFTLPSYDGERYRATVPDTFDIHERAALVQHVLTHAVDPDQDYEVYFGVELGRNPPVMTHGSSDICQVKFLQALPIIRLITGQQERMEVDEAWLRVALRQLGPDGLNYWPVFPYNLDYAPRLDHKDAQHFCYTAATYLAPLAVQHLLTPCDLWQDAMKRMVDGLNSVAIRQGDWAYIPAIMFSPGQARPRSATVPTGTYAVHHAGFPLQGLGICWRLTGYQPAGELARGLAYYLKDHAACFDAEGRFLSEYPAGEAPPDLAGGPDQAHFHSHTLCLLNMLEYALPAMDEELLGFIRRSYEWARTQGEAKIAGARRRQPSWHLGYFPELIHTSTHETSESCEVADMIGLGIKLSAAGLGDYWDDVDGWIRNQFAENQLMHTGWLHEFSQSLPKAGPARPGATDVDVIERNRGAFAGWPMANAFMNHVSEARTQIMHCCTANGARAIYYIWEHILHHREGRLRVNLLLNRASPWADIDSYLPLEGRVEVRVKTPVHLAVRMPAWVDRQEVRCRVDGHERAIGWEGCYAQIGEMQPRQVARIEFPMVEQRLAVEVQKRRYDITLRGAEVVEIAPMGVRGPFYRRAINHGGKASLRDVTRFVASHPVEW